MIIDAFNSINVNILLLDKAYSQILMVEERPKRALDDKEVFFEEEEGEEDESSSSSESDEEVMQVKNDKAEESKKKRKIRGSKVIDLTEEGDNEEVVQKEKTN